MTFKYPQQALTVIAFLTVLVAGCQSGEVDDRPVVVFDFTGDAGVMGCIQPFFPADQPDLLLSRPPVFITDAPNGQAVVDPGDPIDAEITVNGATRQVFVELRDAWSPEVMIYSTQVDTPGNETIPLFLFSHVQSLGRFYMKITLCGFDCDEREVLFDMNPDVNSNYERTLIEGGEVVQSDRTCLDFVPRATVVIQ